MSRPVHLKGYRLDASGRGIVRDAKRWDVSKQLKMKGKPVMRVGKRQVRGFEVKVGRAR